MGASAMAEDALVDYARQVCERLRVSLNLDLLSWCRGLE